MDTHRYLLWSDYLVFALLLILSAAIGIFFAWRSRLQTTTDYLLGGKQMNVFPIAMSLLASFMSAITLLGTPSEIYTYGLMYIWIGPSYFLTMLMASYIYIPVFFRLRLATSYQYLGLRFHKSVQLLASVSFSLQMVIYMGIVLYAPSLALKAVTGLNEWISVACIGIVATFYTTIGGIKAVVWTDVFQIGIMFAGLLVILVKGTVDMGGIGAVWNKNAAGNRTNIINFDLNPTTRHTIWTQFIGNAFVWLSIYGINQTMVQRCLTLRTIKDARKAYWLNSPGLTALMLICSGCGMIIYAAYADCDPVYSKSITKNDQLLPLFVMDYLSSIPCLPGIFVSSLFSGALSTISSGINSLASVTLHDILQDVAFFKKMAEHEKTRVCKLIALFYGLVSLGLAVLASQLGHILQAALQLFGMLGGPVLGLFTLGMLFPIANWKGALVGHAVSQIIIFWIGFGYYIVGVKYPSLSVSTDGCSKNFTVVAKAPPDLNDSSYGIYKVSYTWYSLYGCLITVIVGLVSSLCFRYLEKENTYKPVHPMFLTPIVKRILNLTDDDSELATNDKIAEHNSSHLTTDNELPEKKEIQNVHFENCEITKF